MAEIALEGNSKSSTVEFFSFLKKFLYCMHGGHNGGINLIFWEKVTPMNFRAGEAFSKVDPVNDGYNSLFQILSRLLDQLIDAASIYPGAQKIDDLPDRITDIIDLFRITYLDLRFTGSKGAFTRILRFLLNLYSSDSDPPIGPTHIQPFFSIVYEIRLKPLDLLTECVRADETLHGLPGDIVKEVLPDPNGPRWIKAAPMIHKEKLDEFFREVFVQYRLVGTEKARENWLSTLTAAITFVEAAVQVYHQDTGWKEILGSWELILKQELDKSQQSDESQSAGALHNLREFMCSRSGREF